MGRFRRSWQLAQEAAKVLMADKELIFFPILSACISFIAVVVLTGVLVGIGVFVTGAAVALSSTREVNLEVSGNGPTIFGFVILFIFYLVSSFIVTYFTSGLVGAAMIRLRGGDPTFGDGIRLANQHVGAIFVFAVMSATIGILAAILRGNRKDRNIVGNIAAGVAQTAWNIASYLAIPVMISRPVSAWEAVKESTLLLKKTWGEQLIGSAGIGAIFAIPFVLLVIGGIFGVIMLANAGWGMAALILMLLVIVVIMALAIIQTALSAIYKAAIYLYAAENVETPAFDPALVRTAFQAAQT